MILLRPDVKKVILILSGKTVYWKYVCIGLKREIDMASYFKNLLFLVGTSISSWDSIILWNYFCYRELIWTTFT